MKKKPIARNVATPKGPVFKAPSNVPLGPAEDSRGGNQLPRSDFGKSAVKAFELLQRSAGGSIYSLTVNPGRGNPYWLRGHILAAVEVGLGRATAKHECACPVTLIFPEIDMGGNLHAHGVAWLGASESSASEIEEFIVDALGTPASSSGFRPVHVRRFHEDNGLGRYLTKQWRGREPDFELVAKACSNELQAVWYGISRLSAEALMNRAIEHEALIASRDLLNNRKRSRDMLGDA